jgi:hypothetical protein
VPDSVIFEKKVAQSKFTVKAWVGGTRCSPFISFCITSRRNFESFCLKMPKRCVIYGCSNVADTNKGIAIYQIPFWDDNSPVAVRRRKIWLSFVRRRRDKWIPTSLSVVCSKHFTEDCFVYGSESVEKYNTPRLKRDEHGICVFPTVDTNQLSGSAESEHTSRMKRRKVL